jgi:hypothetical protein
MGNSLMEFCNLRRVGALPLFALDGWRDGWMTGWTTANHNRTKPRILYKMI